MVLKGIHKSGWPAAHGVSVTYVAAPAVKASASVTAPAKGMGMNDPPDPRADQTGQGGGSLLRFPWWGWTSLLMNLHSYEVLGVSEQCPTYLLKKK